MNRHPPLDRCVTYRRFIPAYGLTVVVGLVIHIVQGSA